MSQFTPNNYDNNDETQYIVNNQRLLTEYGRLIRKEVIIKTMFQYQSEINKNCKITIKPYGDGDLTMKISQTIRNEVGFPTIEFRYLCISSTLKLIENVDTDWVEFIKLFNKNYVSIHKYRMNKFRIMINSLQFDFRMRMEGYWNIHKTPIKRNVNNRWNNIVEIRFDRFTTKQSRSVRMNSGVKVFNHNKYILIPNIKLNEEFEFYDGEELFQIQRSIEELIEDSKNSINLIYDKYTKKRPLTETLNIEECCVCYDNTNYITNCNHYLCKDCYDGLIRPKICPLCRKDLKLERVDEIPVQEQKEEPPIIQEEQPIIQEEKEEIIQEQKEEPIEEEQIITENPKYYNIEEQELFNNYILNENDYNVNGTTFKVYHFKIDITDNEITRLFPNCFRNPKIELLCNVRLGYFEVSVETN
jgi:hypothetical protein